MNVICKKYSQFSSSKKAELFFKGMKIYFTQKCVWSVYLCFMHLFWGIFYVYQYQIFYHNILKKANISITWFIRP